MGTQPGTAERMGNVSAEELAAVTAEQAFADADLNHDGRLSFDEFQKWYSAPSSTGQTVQAIADNLPAWVSLKEVRRLTGLEKFSAEEVFEEFAVAADEDGLLAKGAFEACFKGFIRRVGEQSAADDSRTDVVLERLFSIFDSDGNGVVDFSELASGLSVLCSGSRDDKAEAAFSLYDYNGDGFISLDEMTRYLTCVFKVMYETQPGTAERVGVSAEELAAATAEQAFEEADTDANGTLTFDEFQAWYSQSNQEGGDSAAHAAQAVAEAAPSWVSLEEVRRLTGLGAFSVDEVFELFAEATDDEGQISIDAFEACFEELVDASGEELDSDDIDRLRLILSRLYEVFDTDGDGVVD